MLETFRQWFELRRFNLSQQGISLDISPLASEGITNSIHADLRSERYEWTIQLWGNGMSDAHVVDWEEIEKGAEMTHYEFATEDDLILVLEATLQRMFSHSNIALS